MQFIRTENLPAQVEVFDLGYITGQENCVNSSPTYNNTVNGADFEYGQTQCTYTFAIQLNEYGFSQAVLYTVALTSMCIILYKLILLPFNK